MIVGHAASGSVLRIEGFLASNGHPYRRLDPDTDLEAQDIFEDFKEQAARCLPEEMRELIIRINELQLRSREAQTAKRHADDEVQRASAAADAAASDKATVVLALFHDCKSARSASRRADRSAELEES